MSITIKFSKNILLSEIDNKIHSVFHRIELYKLNSIESSELVTVELLKPIRERYTNNKPKFSKYMQGYVFGAVQTYRNLLWDKLEFIYILDDVMYSTSKQSRHRLTAELYKANRGQELCNIKGNFYWKDSDKQYTID